MHFIPWIGCFILIRAPTKLRIFLFFWQNNNEYECVSLYTHFRILINIKIKTVYKYWLKAIWFQDKLSCHSHVQCGTNGTFRAVCDCEGSHKNAIYCDTGLCTYVRDLYAHHTVSIRSGTITTTSLYKQVAVTLNAFINGNRSNIGWKFLWEIIWFVRFYSTDIGRPLDENPLSKSNRILTHVIDLVNSTYVKHQWTFVFHIEINEFRNNKCVSFSCKCGFFLLFFIRYETVLEFLSVNSDRWTTWILPILSLPLDKDTL